MKRTGRTIFRRTKQVWSKNGRRHSHIVQRPPEDWIEIDGATPRIIDQQTWERVQQILADPERLRPQPESRHYLLASRIRCGVCGSAMVGQTLTNRGKPYRYYRCRHVYDKNTGHDCSARYVSAGPLEVSVLEEVKRVLADPEVVLFELRQAGERGAADAETVGRLERELVTIEKREKRLIQLFLIDDLNQEALRDEAANLKRQKDALDVQLRSMKKVTISGSNNADDEQIRLICQAIAGWLDSASEEQCAKVLEALQISVHATRDEATLRGVLPTEVPKFVTTGRTSA